MRPPGKIALIGAVFIAAASCTDLVHLTLDALEVVDVSPDDGSTGVDLASVVEVTFSSPPSLESVASNGFQLVDGTSSVLGTIEILPTNAVLRFTPAARLRYARDFSLFLTTSVQDASGANLVTGFSSAFATRDIRWCTGVPLSTDGAFATNARVAVVPTGYFVSWDNSAGAVFSVRYSRASVSWSLPERLDMTPNNVAGPVIASSSSGNVVVAWTQPGTAYNEVWVNRYEPSGVGWQGAEKAATALTGLARDLQVSVDTMGVAYLVYVMPTDSGRDDLHYSTHVPGSGWQGSFAEGYPGHAGAPRMTALPAGALMVWQQYDGPGFSDGIIDVWASEYVSGLGWQPRVALESSETGDATNPAVSADRNGNALVVFQQSDGMRTNIFANAFRGSWSGPVPLEMLDTAARNPHVAMNRAGEGIAVWEQSDGTRWNVWANRFVGTWQGAVQLDLNGPGDALTPDVALDERGNAFVVWIESDGVRRNVWSRRLLDDVWLEPRVAENDDFGEMYDPDLLLSGESSGAAVWKRDDSALNRVFGACLE